MSSTSTSNVILEVQDLGLAYDLDYYQNQTLRDHFTNFLSAPRRLFQGAQQHLVLDHLSFKISQGERVGLIGVNGAGKTSLCRCISKMITPRTGEIRMRGKIRSIFNATVGVQPELTGRENARLLTALMYPELHRAEQDHVLEEALNFSELDHFINAPFKTYSKGMQTRLCLSVLTARPSDLLILDEVSDGADEFFRKKMRQRLNQLIENSGATLIVSHNLEEVRQLCQRLIVLSEAKIHFDGPVEPGIQAYLKLNPA